ncbi:uncharacterized protein LOC110012109 [Sesamum indicum]|uniref:Uncharacterized protein LOC110012109 n=1 Tax=Sesamum indicum TaxID=4182 RepID=A0A8M8V128_SESIN|nr:uncharacterized protein LOC110012109 [Sesamum indicum]XP_020549985.1 uncharacterized protein LOC110012109 [Sesamum indicum]
MEIPAWWWFSFWALISITFLHLGFYALDKADLSRSVSPVVMSLFKHSLAVSCCHSSSYALIFRPQSKLTIELRYLWVLYGGLPFLLLSDKDGIIIWGCLLWAMIKFSAWPFRFPELSFFADRFSLFLLYTFFHSDFFPWMCFPVSTFVNFFLVPFGGYYLTREQKAGIRIHMAVESSLYLVRGNSTKFFPVLVLLISLFTSALWAALLGLDPLSCVSGDPLSGDVRFQNLLSLAGKRLTDTFRVLKEKKTWKFIEFAVGIVGTALFQNFFRLTSFSQVEAFFYLAVVWVANLALLGVSCDFGVFNFLLGNVIVGCMVSELGLRRGTTWLACGASLLLFGLRLKLESLRFLDSGGEHAGVSLPFVDRGGELARVISPIVDRRGDEAKVILW